MSVPTPPADDAAPSATPQRNAMRLRQLIDMSNARPVEGDSVVYNATSGKWEPRNVTPGDNEITDAMIGERTIDDTVAMPTANNLMLGAILSIFAALIKAITGKADWKTLPAISLEALNLHAARHATGGADPLTPAQIGAADATHLHANATSGSAGFMSPTDKSKLDGVATGATNTPLSGALPTALTVAGAGSGGTSAAAARHDHSHPMPGIATESQDGFISAASMVKVNQSALLSNVMPQALVVNGAGAVGTNTLYAARADHKHDMPGTATTSAAGFMSSSDKNKLDGIASNATNTVLSNATPDPITAGNSGSAGTSTGAARADHVHPTTNFVPNLPSVWDVLSSAYTIPTTYTNIAGLSVTPNNNGLWFVIATLDVRCVTDTGQLMNFRIMYNSAEYGNSSFLSNSSGERANITVMALVQTTNFSAITVQAKKTGGTGTSAVEVLGTKLIAYRISS